MEKTLNIIGGGMAGSEAAWQAANAGVKVVIHEMRPKVETFAHRTGNLGEMVCSEHVVVCSTGTDVPNIQPDGTCYVSDPARATSTYDCDRVPDSGGELSGKRRVCCCNETLPVVSCESPVLGEGNRSCTEACASIGKQCTVAALAALNPLVDTEAELGVLIGSLGANCTSYSSDFG